jgi:hypothetical protein
LDDFLQKIFVELHAFDEENNRRQEAVEQLPEMREHRSKKRNMLRAENIMQWLESEKSELLWIDGSGILSRSEFNSLFALPLLILGENTFESVLLLRHFCGDRITVHTNNYRTLLQSLLYQVFKQRPKLFEDQLASMTRKHASDLLHLWNVFVKCLKEVNADCTFIIIDSIDCLQSGEVRNGVSERDIVLRQLETLVADNQRRIKILLTASIAHNPANIKEGNSIISPFHTQKLFTNQQLSSSIYLNETFLRENIVAMQERTCRNITFAHLSLLFPINSIFYAEVRGKLQAYVVCELGGMDHKFLNTYSPLHIRGMSVGYNGRRFCKEYHSFSISQFPGEKEITSLKYVPSGYLPNEPERRQELIARGRKYWQPGSQVHYKQVLFENVCFNLKSSGQFSC